jgi:hypothetical protein
LHFEAVFYGLASDCTKLGLGLGKPLARGLFALAICAPRTTVSYSTLPSRVRLALLSTTYPRDRHALHDLVSFWYENNRRQDQLCCAR